MAPEAQNDEYFWNTHFFPHLHNVPHESIQEERQNNGHEPIDNIKRISVYATHVRVADPPHV